MLELYEKEQTYLEIEDASNDLVTNPTTTITDDDPVINYVVNYEKFWDMYRLVQVNEVFRRTYYNFTSDARKVTAAAQRDIQEVAGVLFNHIKDWCDSNPIKF